MFDYHLIAWQRPFWVVAPRLAEVDGYIQRKANYDNIFLTKNVDFHYKEIDETIHTQMLRNETLLAEGI